MKKTELLFSFLLVPLDYLMIVLAGICAYYLRFTSLAQGIWPIIFNLDFSHYLGLVLIVALVWLLVFMLSGLYSISINRQPMTEVRKVILACFASLALIVIYIFFKREFFNSRFIILFAWAFSMIFVLGGRILMRVVRRILFHYGVGVSYVLIVGAGKTADVLMREFAENSAWGYRVAKRVRDFSMETMGEMEEFIVHQKLTGTIDGQAGSRLDEIIQADPNLSKVETLRLYDFANEYHFNFRYVADLLGIKVLRNEVTEIAGMPVVAVKRTTLEGWGQIYKRIFDIICSGILIVVFSPVMLITAIIIKLDSNGPIFFSKRDDGSYLYRVGQGGKPFKYFKFRSMINNCDNMRYKELANRNLRQDGPLVKIADDPRVTRVGKFIRKYSIDELPELFLVFIGRMSLVGPRPHLPEEVARYDGHHRKTLTINPGITGMAQISGRSDLAFEEEVKLDIYYIENWSLWLDISILLKTPMAVLKHRSAE